MVGAGLVIQPGGQLVQLGDGPQLVQLGHGPQLVQLGNGPQLVQQGARGGSARGACGAV